MNVWLIKPSVDDRDGADVIKSRIGLSENADVILPDTDIVKKFSQINKVDVVIADECQFFTPVQIDQLREIVDETDTPVLCFGLRTDFLTNSFPGSLRLFEIADSIQELKTICECGSKAIVNARINSDGKVITKGEQVYIGGSDSYIAMCHKCWKKAIKENREVIKK